MTTRRRGALATLASVAITLALALSIAACGATKVRDSLPAPTGNGGDGAPATTPQAVAEAPPIVEIVVDDTGFTAPGTVPAGLKAMSLQNMGAKAHGAMLLKLHDNASRDQVRTALADDPSGVTAFRLVTASGGPGRLAPGSRQATYDTLSKGDYFIADPIVGPDNVMRIDPNTLTSLVVTDPDPDAPSVAAPASGLTARITGTGIEIPPDLSAGGLTTLKVSNVGTQANEFSILKVDPVATVDQARGFLLNAQPSGEAPFTFVGGGSAVETGKTMLLSLDLPPGRYLVVSLLPNIVGGTDRPLVDGISAALTVAS